jgi:uncharacterized protein YidB (DUF937 family)
MGLLDEVLNHVQTQGGGNDSNAAMANAVLGMLGGQGGAGGGLPDLISSLQANGLGDAVNSWVSTGPNQAVSPDRLRSALGADQIARLAQQAGLSPEAAKSVLAVVLPLVVDKLTPGGQVPQQSMLADGLGILKKLI